MKSAMARHIQAARIEWMSTPIIAIGNDYPLFTERRTGSIVAGAPRAADPAHR